MNKLKLFVLGIALLLSGSIWAQTQTAITAANSGTTIDLTAQSDEFVDDGGIDGNYSANQDNYVILTANCTGDNVLRLCIHNIDIAPSDTLFIYDGASTSAPILVRINNNMPNTEMYYYPSNLNTSKSLTVRFKTSTHSLGAEGFHFKAECALPCVSLTPNLQINYYKARNGVIYDSAMTIGNRWQVDTAWQTRIDSTQWRELPNGGRDYYKIDTLGFDTVHTNFIGLEICEGDSLILKGYGTYGSGIYNPTDRTTIFQWNWGDGDTLSFGGLVYGGHKYRTVGCFDATLSLEDYIGCRSASIAEVRVRISQMPIKTIYDLPNMCNVDSTLVNVGFEGEGATLTLKKIEFSKTATKTYPVRTFCPDGPRCPIRCFQAPVTFNEFPSGSKVNSKDDICSICLNYEHEFMGDYSLAVICPSGNRAILKWGQYTPNVPSGYSSGGGTYTGYPYGGNGHHTYDAIGGVGECDSLGSFYGDGIEYCWSRNKAYTLQTGEDAAVQDVFATNGNNFVNAQYNLDRHINGNGYMLQVINHQFQTIVAPFANAGQTAPAASFTTKMGSDHAAKTGYYIPDADFSELVGCPLNGQWSYEMCDDWGSDNGWIFSWSMDICGISSGGCEYQVGIDSVVWTPDSAYGDFQLGHWRGVTIWDRDETSSYIASPDTAGRFPIHITIYDEFGCVWDTLTRITTVWNPMPDLKDTITICGVETVVLDATDRTTPFTNQTYMWEPFGDTAAVIESRPNVGSSTLYMVQVTNTQEGIRCTGRDSTRVNFFKSPTPNFDPGIYPLEGCEPFTVNFQNTSADADSYHWVFGDGFESTKENPIHTYATGQYGFKFYVTTNEGCKDSLVYDNLITVFPSPVAKFSWEPINPTVLHPQVHFINNTEPQNDAVKFYWEVQYDRENPLSYHTMREVNPDFQWTTDGEDISGTYIARLIAKTDERGPSGHVLECRDTVENTILLVNDFLQFPNVITANGDGVNDVFEIKNLVDGLGYPNNSLSIYNRWGKRVYHKTNISSKEDFWDPAKDNMPSGTYFWRFSGKGYLGNIERNGAVEVLR